MNLPPVVKTGIIAIVACIIFSAICSMFTPLEKQVNSIPGNNFWGGVPGI